MTALPFPQGAVAGPTLTRRPRAARSEPIASLSPVILAAQRGDMAAQAYLLRNLQDMVYRFSLSMLRDPHMAADAAQETALRILAGLPGFRYGSTLETWSLGIALNVCREIRRRSARVEPLRECDAPETPDAHVHRGERRAALHTLLQTLTDRQREVVVLRYFEDLSIEQIARIMNCATGTIKATLFQSLRILRNRWRHEP